MTIKWPSVKPISLFIDNSAFRAMSYNLSHPTFKTLEMATRRGDIQLLTSAIAKGEFIKHASALMRDESEKIRRLGVSRSLFEEEIESLRTQLVEVTGEKIWNHFLDRFKPQNVDCAIDWKVVFQDYFDLRPPFSSKKGEEFADAFNMKMLENFDPQFLIVVSSDPDYRDWANNRQGTVFYSKISEFTNEYLKIADSAFSKIANYAFSLLQGEILKRVKSDFSDDYHYTISASHAEIQSANVIELAITSASLEQVDELSRIANFRIRCRGTTELELSCPVIVWDSIDKEEIRQGSNSKVGYVEIEIVASVEMHIMNQHPSNATFTLFDQEIFAEEFNVPDQWETFLDVTDEDAPPDDL